jgi:hypothetical protein
MSNTVKRYHCWDPQTLDENQEIGDLVDLSDYQALEAEAVALRARLTDPKELIAALVAMGAKLSKSNEPLTVFHNGHILSLPPEMLP